MAKPTLYVALDGPVLGPHENYSHLLDAGIAPYAKPFLHWAKDRFQVQWVTDRSPVDAFHTAELLGLSGDAVAYRGVDGAKTDHMDPKHDFHWVDSMLIPGEIEWLTKHGKLDRVIIVDPRVGVTEHTKKELEKKIR